MHSLLFLIAIWTLKCEAQLNFMSFLDPDKMGRMVQLAQDLTRAAAGGVVANERDSLQRARSSQEAVNLNAPPSELFAQGFQNLMLPARQGILNALSGQPIVTSTTTTTTTTTTRPFTFPTFSPFPNPFTPKTPKKPVKRTPKNGGKKKIKILKKPRFIDEYEPEDFSKSSYSSDYSYEEYNDSEEIMPKPKPKPKPQQWGKNRKPRAQATLLQRMAMRTTTTTTIPPAEAPSIDSQPETALIEQNPFLRLAQSFLRGATGSATDNSDSGVELRPTFKSPPRSEPVAQPDMSGLQAVARAFMGSPSSSNSPSHAQGVNTFETSGIARSAPTIGTQKELGVLDFNNMARLAQAFMGGSSPAQPSYPEASATATEPLNLSPPTSFSAPSNPNIGLINSGARALGTPISETPQVSPGSANMQAIARLAQAFLGSGNSESKSAAPLIETPRSEGVPTLTENPNPHVQQKAIEGLRSVAEAFMGGARSAARDSSTSAATGARGGESRYSLPSIKDFLPGAGNNFGLQRGEGCLPFLSEAMQLAYGNCQREADQKAFDTWGNEIKNAILDGRMDLLRASKETCKRTVERQQCGALREAISNCDIMESLKIGSQLQREVKRCDEVTGIIDQNPMAVISQVSQLMTGEVAQGFFSNFLKG